MSGCWPWSQLLPTSRDAVCSALGSNTIALLGRGPAPEFIKIVYNKNRTNKGLNRGQGVNRQETNEEVLMLCNTFCSSQIG